MIEVDKFYRITYYNFSIAAPGRTERAKLGDEKKLASSQSGIETVKKQAMTRSLTKQTNFGAGRERLALTGKEQAA
jgi:hypothetical protein